MYYSSLQPCLQPVDAIYNKDLPWRYFTTFHEYCSLVGHFKWLHWWRIAPRALREGCPRKPVARTESCGDGLSNRCCLIALGHFKSQWCALVCSPSPQLEQIKSTAVSSWLLLCHYPGDFYKNVMRSLCWCRSKYCSVVSWSSWRSVMDALPPCSTLCSSASERRPMKKPCQAVLHRR